MNAKSDRDTSVNIKSAGYSLKKLRKETKRLRKRIDTLKTLRVYNNDGREDQQHPGVVAPAFPQFLMLASNKIQTLVLSEVHWTSRSFALFCKSLVHMEVLEQVELMNCWFSKPPMFPLTEALARREKPLHNLTLLLKTTEAQNLTAKELWLKSRFISKRLVYEWVKFHMQPEVFARCEKQMLTAGEKMPSMTDASGSEPKILYVGVGAFSGITYPPGLNNEVQISIGAQH